MADDFTTHASNFVSAVQTGVDPRTGQFSFSFPLLTVQANHLLGPAVELSLHYSSLTDQDLFGFGRGVKLHGISVYDTRNGVFTMSTGETWTVDASGDMPGRRLKDCDFSHIEGKHFLHWKNGTVEVLGQAGDHIYVTEKLIAPSGRYVSFEWSGNGFPVRLRSVKDDFGTVLCYIDYQTLQPLMPHTEWVARADVSVTAWPGVSKQAGQVGLTFTNGYLTLLHRRGLASPKTSLSWTFSYEELEARHVLRQLKHPTGLTDEVTYRADQEGGLLFPHSSGKQSVLAAVSKHIRRFGRGQPDCVFSYKYTEKNFLGYQASSSVFGRWHAHEDYLSGILTEGEGAYVYGSTESLTLNGKTREITRRYNNYHQLIEEQSRQGNSIVETRTAYHARGNTALSAQPATYLLPVKHQVSYKSAEAGSASRTETTTTDYDDYGNPLLIRRADGTEEHFVWYPAAGIQGHCPAEPNGLVRFLQEKRTVPPTVDGYSVPTKFERYTYKKLGNSGCIVQDKYIVLSSDFLLNERQTTYNESPLDMAFGRIISITDTIHDTTERNKSYVSAQHFETTIDAEGLMTQVILHRSHDGLEVKQKRVQSVYSGLIYEDTDEQGVVTRYTYDAFGRIINQLHAANTRYVTGTYWTYNLTPEGAETIVETKRGGSLHLCRKVRFVYDGAGRAVQQDLYDLAGTHGWYSVLSHSYDGEGRVLESIGRDWTGEDRRLQADKGSIELRTSYRYDDWGNQCLEEHADGKFSHIDYDPVLLKKTIYQTSATRRSGRLVEHLDAVTKRPKTIEMLDDKGHLTWKEERQWDGLGQLRQLTSMDGHVTRWTYDVYGRVAEQVLPDGSLVKKNYAPYLSDDHAKGISVSPTATATAHLIGTQEFDGLGRLTEAVYGRRKTKYVYKHAHSRKPDVVDLPAGGQIEYRYIAELADAVSAITGKQTLVDAGVHQLFSYDVKTHQLSSATEGEQGVRLVYGESGMLKAESFTSPHAPARYRKRVAVYDKTLLGKVETYEDITAKKTNFTLDEIGRVRAVDDGIVSATIQYNDMGKTEKVILRSREPKARELTTKLTYDAFNREVRRVLTNDRGKVLTLDQSWQGNGQLASRKLSSGAVTVCEEEFRYDKRNRLIGYRAEGNPVPSLKKQSYTYDVLNNLSEVITTYRDGTSDTARYEYGTTDPTQLLAVTHTHPRSRTELRYDAAGRMIHDDKGRTLTYDVLGRLTGMSGSQAENSRYSYDALNRLVSQWIGNDETATALFYRGGALITEISAAAERRFVRTGHVSLAVGEGKELTLLGTNQSGSIICSETNSATAPSSAVHLWLPYGEVDNLPHLSLGFNGERKDPVSSVYHLGNGYRAYNPALMRFHCPDSLSPFGAGGINAYTYCAGDPVNHIDPSGHISGWSIAGIIAGAIGIGLAVFTAGSSIAAAGGVIAAMQAASIPALIAGTAGVVADATGVASIATAQANPGVADALGYTSFAFGAAALATGIGMTAPKLAKSIHNASQGSGTSRAFTRTTSRLGEMQHQVHEMEVVTGSSPDTSTSFSTLRNARMGNETTLSRKPAFRSPARLNRTLIREQGRIIRNIENLDTETQSQLVNVTLKNTIRKYHGKTPDARKLTVLSAHISMAASEQEDTLAMFEEFQLRYVQDAGLPSSNVVEKFHEFLDQLQGESEC